MRRSQTELDARAAAWLIEPDCANPRSTDIRLYLHALCVEDITIQSLLREGAPLFSSVWRKLGEPVDAAALREYASVVHASTDDYLGGLPPEGLRRVIDLASFGQARHTVAWIVRHFVVQELNRITGEIASRPELLRTHRSAPPDGPGRRPLSRPHALPFARPIFGVLVER